jgi:hypothetical protein
MNADTLFILMLMGAALAAQGATAPNAPAWAGFAGNAQHTGATQTPARPMLQVHWQTQLDRQAQAEELTLAHYASPLVTSGNTVLLAVREGLADGWHVHARQPGLGVIWRMTSDYVLPPHDWTPAFPMALTSQNVVYAAGAGGTVFARASADAPEGSRKRLAFYGTGVFEAHAASMTASVMIDTPITADAAGDVFFGYVVTGGNPAGLASGIARIAASGEGTWISASEASGDPTMTQVAMGSAPALSADGSTLYIVVSNGASGTLLGLDAGSLAPKYKVALRDPASGNGAWISDDSSASPTIGPDGDVYYGVLENPYLSHNGRGWLLHWDSTLKHARIPGSFGWDQTVSVVPASALQGYHGSSSYLLVAKANNLRGLGTGDGRNRLVLLDPAGTGTDPVLPGVAVMSEIESLQAPTAVAGAGGGTYAWCVNAAVADVVGGAVFAANEDGYLYRWSLSTNTVSRVALAPPGTQAYTPTIVGPNGLVLAMANGILFAVGP